MCRIRACCSSLGQPRGTPLACTEDGTEDGGDAGGEDGGDDGDAGCVRCSFIWRGKC